MLKVVSLKKETSDNLWKSSIEIAEIFAVKGWAAKVSIKESSVDVLNIVETLPFKRKCEGIKKKISGIINKTAQELLRLLEEINLSWLSLVFYFILFSIRLSWYE